MLIIKNIQERTTFSHETVCVICAQTSAFSIIPWYSCWKHTRPGVCCQLDTCCDCRRQANAFFYYFFLCFMFNDMSIGWCCNKAFLWFDTGEKNTIISRWNLAIRPTKGGAERWYINKCTTEPDQLLPGSDSHVLILCSGLSVNSRWTVLDSHVSLKGI